MLKSLEGRAVKKAPRRRPYSCDVCPKQFETPSKLARHYLTHTGQKPFQCQDCSKTFRQMVHLERHMTTHALPFQCNICHRHFKNADTFSKHQRLHLEGARLKARLPKKPASTHQRRCLALPPYCFGCQKAFESEEKRLLHQCDFVNGTANRKAESQQCDLCDKVFPTRSKLARHFMIHTGQRPFACILCGKAFRQKAHLKIHELTHTQERPFQCSQCFKSFKRPEQLFKHESGHVAVPSVQINGGISATELLQVKEEPEEIISVFVIPFQCSTCDQCFDSQEILDGHMCAGINTHVTGCDGIPVKNPKRRSIYLDPPGAIFPTDSEPSERALKTEHLEGTELGDLSALDYRQLAVPKNILQLRPQQKVKPPRKHFGQSHLLLGRHFRNPRFNINNNRMIVNRDAGTLHSTFHAAEERDPFHHFLQQAQNLLLTRRKVRRCDRCEKTFPSMSKLRRHYLIHTGQKPFTCAECGRNFRQSAHLKRHQVTHAERDPLYKPQIALGDYQSLSFDPWQENPSYQFNQHSCRPIEDSQDFSVMAFVPEIKVEIEAADLPEVLKKPVVTKRARITLPRVHNAKSSQERALQKLRTQAVQKRYRCNLCSKNFHTPSKLERHHLTHSGQRPYVCQECGKSFRQDPHLKRHMVTHGNMTA